MTKMKQDKGKLVGIPGPVNINPQRRTETGNYPQKNQENRTFYAILQWLVFALENWLLTGLPEKFEKYRNGGEKMNNSELNAATKPVKVKKTYAFTPEVAELIETHKYAVQDREIDFVSQAVRHYCAEIDGQKNLDVLCDRMYKIISAEIDSQTNRMVNMLFKIAVEMAIQNRMLAAGYVALTDQEMRSVRNECLNTVRKSHGFILFEQALAEERKYSD